MDGDVVRLNGNLPLLALSRVWMPPDEYTSIGTSSKCRIFHTALSQKNCGACVAFAVATFVSMHACLRDQEDFIPSPYRLFDCANGTCESGVTYRDMLSMLRFGVGDINASVPQYGQPCALQFHAPKMHRHAPRITDAVDDPLQIKAALLLFGPLLGIMARVHDRDPVSGAYRRLTNGTLSYETRMHAIVLVGWDAAGNWIVQNSWGHEWGDSLGRGRIAQDALALVFDPIRAMAVRGCYILLVLNMVCVVLAAPKRYRRISLAGCIALSLFGLLPMMMWSWGRWRL